MKKKYYVSGIYFTKTIEELNAWLLMCRECNLVFGDNTLLKRFRQHKNNYARAEFISMLVDEELEALVSLVNMQEYFCITNIIKRLEVSDHKKYIDKIFNDLYRGKKKLIEKETEILVNNRLTKVKFVREVVSFE